jgi:hypothetical protein
MIRLGYYHCRWAGCSHKTQDGDAMDAHVVEEHINR